ncbi:MAG: NAD(P)H-hydrate dehydratase [Burkholderiales bacterium]
MIPVVTKQMMRDIDAYMIERMRIPSSTLMENAAFGVTEAVTKRFGVETPVIVVCGAGNNGGDGFAAARQLMAKGYAVEVYLVGEFGELKDDARRNAEFFMDRLIEITDAASARANLSDLFGCVLIDALFGTGLSRNVTGLFAEVIDLINGSEAYIISCDIPSGIDADTGEILGAAVKADATVTFQYPKRGHFLFPGREHTGKLTVKEIGVSSGADTGNIRAVDSLKLEKRNADSHKGSFGKLAIVAGSQGFSGAAVMCTKAALRSGAGLVTAGVPLGIQPIISAAAPESMTYALSDESGALAEDCLDGIDSLMRSKTAAAIGPGLGTGSGAHKAVYHLLRNYDIQKVFDADALNCIADDPDVLYYREGDVVLTPHPGEFSRLCGMEIDDILHDPISAAEEFAQKYRVTLLLKGATTIVTNGKKTALVTAGSPGMAKGGSGDVLTGVIGSLMCGGRQGGMEGFPAALYGAYICGKAGEAAAAQKGVYSMTAIDTLEHIPEIMKQMSE